MQNKNYYQNGAPFLRYVDMHKDEEKQAVIEVVVQSRSYHFIILYLLQLFELVFS